MERSDSPDSEMERSDSPDFLMEPLFGLIAINL